VVTPRLMRSETKRKKKMKIKTFNNYLDILIPMLIIEKKAQNKKVKVYGNQRNKCCFNRKKKDMELIVEKKSVSN
jgi:hypothetical protein